jgi:hypothetical protein
MSSFSHESSCIQAFQSGQPVGVADSATATISMADELLGLRPRELRSLDKTIPGPCESKESPDVNVSLNAAACAAVADARSPEQIKAELVELQRAIQEEANRYSAN